LDLAHAVTPRSPRGTGAVPDPPARPLLEWGATAAGCRTGLASRDRGDPRDDDPPEVAVLCPDCWEREFGESE